MFSDRAFLDLVSDEMYFMKSEEKIIMELQAKLRNAEARIALAEVENFAQKLAVDTLAEAQKEVSQEENELNMERKLAENFFLVLLFASVFKLLTYLGL